RTATSCFRPAPAGARSSTKTRCGHTRRRRYKRKLKASSTKPRIPMIIDWHTHVHSPREQAAPFWGGKCPATIDNVLRLHDEVGLDVSVISNSGHYLKEYIREEALPAIREANQYLASLRDKHKGRLVALAVTIPGGGDEHLKELERAVRQDDLRGVL